MAGPGKRRLLIASCALFLMLSLYTAAATLVRHIGLKRMNRKLVEVARLGLITHPYMLVPDHLPDSENLYVDLRRAADRFSRILMDNQVLGLVLRQGGVISPSKGVIDALDESAAECSKVVDGLFTASRNKSRIQSSYSEMHAWTNAASRCDTFSSYNFTEDLDTLTFVYDVCRAFLWNRAKHSDFDACVRILTIMSRIALAQDATPTLQDLTVKWSHHGGFLVAFEELVRSKPDVDVSSVDIMLDKETFEEAWKSANVAAFSIELNRISCESGRHRSFLGAFTDPRGYMFFGHDMSERLERWREFAASGFGMSSADSGARMNATAVASALAITGSYHARFSYQSQLQVFALLLRYKKDHNRYPATLAELAPAYTSRVPVDPATGSDFSYGFVGGKLVLSGFNGGGLSQGASQPARCEMVLP